MPCPFPEIRKHGVDIPLARSAKGPPMENILKDISRFSGDFSGNPGNTPADERIFPTTGFIGLYCGIRQFMKAISPVTVSFFFFTGILPEGGQRRSSRLRGAAVPSIKGFVWPIFIHRRFPMLFCRNRNGVGRMLSGCSRLWAMTVSCCRTISGNRRPVSKAV